MKKMTTFFHAGPIMLTGDIPAFDPQKRLDENYDLSKKALADAIPLPSLQIADWNWLQPYNIADNKDTIPPPPPEKWETIEGDNTPTFKSSYMPLGVKKADTQPLFLKGPYTAVEGYMQLRGPIEKEPPKSH